MYFELWLFLWRAMQYAFEPFMILSSSFSARHIHLGKFLFVSLIDEMMFLSIKNWIYAVGNIIICSDPPIKLLSWIYNDPV